MKLRNKILIISMIFWSFALYSQVMSYDDLNRLTKADYGNGYVINYEYDKLGNRTKKTVNAGCYSISGQDAYVQGFEHGLGDWRQIETDEENWAAETGPTLSGPNGPTGPSSSNEGNTYLYTESSSGNNNKSMILQSGCYSIPLTGSANFTIDYHMYGTGIKDLTIQMSVNGGAYTTILFKSGNQGNAWQQFSYNLSQQSGQTVRFRIIGKSGSTWRGDLAIDNIRIGANCPSNLVFSNTLFNNLTVLPGQERLASNMVESTSTLTNGVFHFGANQMVTLKGGFEVKQGVTFLGDSNGCVQ